MASGELGSLSQIAQFPVAVALRQESASVIILSPDMAEEIVLGMPRKKQYVSDHLVKHLN